MDPSSSTWQATNLGTYERSAGEGETAFILATANDACDMFIHLGFQAPSELVLPERVIEAWSVIRARHPVLASSLIFREGSWILSFRPPFSAEAAVEDARQSFSVGHESKSDCIDRHLNGPRTISADHQSHLSIVTSGTSHDLYLTAPHFLGDGLPIHNTFHELLVLLSNPASIRCELELALSRIVLVLPPALEDWPPLPSSRKLQKAAQVVDYQLARRREIGGHILGRVSHPVRKAVMEEFTLDKAQTAKVLAKCKQQGVTPSNLAFAIVAMAWAKVTKKSDPSLPIMIYTAMNLRPYLTPPPSHPKSYWFLALGYFNIILPSYLPQSADTNSILWERARSARRQTKQAVSSRNVISRNRVMSAERAARARSEPSPYKTLEETASLAPSLALCGLSCAGNLDNIYLQSEYHSELDLTSVMTVSKLKAGGLLVLSHTFRGQLNVQIAWDSKGFEEGTIEKLWTEIRTIFTAIADE